MYSKSGRGGGTFAHRDIAFEFASWISAEFKLYIITDYQRLKADENSRLSLNWNMNREISKINYKIHTDAIKEHLIVPELPARDQSFTYATEADVLNVAMFGQTAKQWRETHPALDGNIRDHATLQQLIVISNMKSLKAEMIKQGMERDRRLQELNLFVSLFYRLFHAAQQTFWFHPLYNSLFVSIMEGKTNNRKGGVQNGYWGSINANNPTKPQCKAAE